MRKSIESTSLLSIRDFIVERGELWAMDSKAYKVFRLDTNLTTVVQRVGGHGKGPGELDALPISMQRNSSGLVVHTSNGTSHFFDSDLRFVSKHVPRSGRAIQSVALQPGGHLACVQDYTLLEKHGGLFELRPMATDFGSSGKPFVWDHGLANEASARCKLASDYRKLAVAASGSHAVWFYDHSGKLLSKTVIDRWPSESLQYAKMEASSLAAMRARGFRDGRIPAGEIIADIALSSHGAVVLGGAFAPAPHRSVALILPSGEVVYTEFERPTAAIHAEGGLIHALEFVEDAYFVATYRWRL